MKKRPQEKQKIIAIVGPNAVGKSALAVRLARRFNGEIISADSRQVYRGLNIGTGKITKKEMRGIPHHLLDVADPKKQFNVVDYQRIAREKISEIFSRGKIPIICGGTGLYIDALLGNIAIPEVPPDPALRKKLEKKSSEELFEILKKLDAVRAQTIDRHNPRRLIRAIEIAEGIAERTRNSSRFTHSGMGSDTQRNFSCAPLFGVAWVGLTLPREVLKKKILQRLVCRIKRGMINEARRLHKNGLSWRRCEELGLEYRFVSHCLRGLLTKEEMLAKLQTEIWHYAKRQMTWFKRNKEIKWFNPNQKRQIYAMLKSKGL